MSDNLFDPLTGQWYNPRIYEIVSEIGNSLRNITYQTYSPSPEQELFSNLEYTNMSSRS